MASPGAGVSDVSLETVCCPAFLYHAEFVGMPHVQRMHRCGWYGRTSVANAAFSPLVTTFDTFRFPNREGAQAVVDPIAF